MQALDLEKNPTIKELRAHLDEYLEESKQGRQFRIFYNRIHIGVLGADRDMPEEFRNEAVEIGFADVEGDLKKTLVRSLSKAAAIRMYRLTKGKNTLPRRGRRRTPIAQDKKFTSAIWPVSQNILVADLTKSIARIEQQLKSLAKEIKPITEKIIDIRALDEEILEKRRKAEQLDQTIVRLASRSG